MAWLVVWGGVVELAGMAVSAVGVWGLLLESVPGLRAVWWVGLLLVEVVELRAGRERAVRGLWWRGASSCPC